MPHRWRSPALISSIFRYTSSLCRSLSLFLSFFLSSYFPLLRFFISILFFGLVHVHRRGEFFGGPFDRLWEEEEEDFVVSLQFLSPSLLLLLSPLSLSLMCVGTLDVFTVVTFIAAISKAGGSLSPLDFIRRLGNRQLIQSIKRASIVHQTGADAALSYQTTQRNKSHIK